jgi:hypothetical protein
MYHVFHMKWACANARFDRAIDFENGKSHFTSYTSNAFTFQPLNYDFNYGLQTIKMFLVTWIKIDCSFGWKMVHVTARKSQSF